MNIDLILCLNGVAQIIPLIIPKRSLSGDFVF